MFHMLLDRIYSKKFNPSSDDLSITVDLALAALEQHFIDPMLNKFDLHVIESSKINPEELAVVLRVTSSWRASIPGYNYSLGLCKNACIRHDIDHHDLMIGMI